MSSGELHSSSPNFIRTAALGWGTERKKLGGSTFIMYPLHYLKGPFFVVLPFTLAFLYIFRIFTCFCAYIIFVLVFCKLLIDHI